MRKAALFIAGLAIISSIVILLFSFAVEEKPKGDGRLTVAASFYPLAHFAQKAGGEAI